MDFTSIAFLDGFQVPLPVTLACACVCSYLIGQLAFSKPRATAPDTGSTDADRAKRLLDQLAHEIHAFRDDLLAHEAGLNAFKQDLLTEDDNRPSSDQFTEDAKQALRAMQHLADEMPRAFQSIQRTTSWAVDALRIEFDRADGDRSEFAAATGSTAESQLADRQEFVSITDHT